MSTAFVDIGNDELEALLAQGVPIVDIRTAPEWGQTGVVRGSYLLTFFDAYGQYDAKGFLRDIEIGRAHV